MTDAEFTNWPKALQLHLWKQNTPHIKMQQILKQSYSFKWQNLE